MRYLLVLAALCSMAGCALVKPRYSPASDLRSENLEGEVKKVTSRQMEVDGQDPDDPDRPTDFDILIITEYDLRGNVTLQETFSAGGEKLSKRDIYTYDGMGRLVASEYHDMLRSRVEWLHYRYDGKGRLESYYPVGGDWEARYEYGKKDYPARLVTVVADTVQSVVRYRYDGRGRLVREGSGSAAVRYKYKGKALRESTREFYREYYDDNGELVRTVNVVTDRTIPDHPVYEGVINAIYLYDDRGNWIRRELSMNGRTFTVWTREIEYYGSE